MHIIYKPLWHTLVERDMKKEDLRLSAGLATNMIANMGGDRGDYYIYDLKLPEENRPIGSFGQIHQR